jgi:hypothetical protein
MVARMEPSNRRKYAERELAPSDEESAKVALLMMASV